MRTCICLLLIIATLTLAGCQTAPGAESDTELVPLVQQPIIPQTQPPTEPEPEPEGNLIEVPGRVYDVPWQDRELLAEGGYTFTDSTIPVFLYSQEEVDDALEKLVAYVQRELMDADGALRYSEILGIAPDFLATSEFLSPESRKAEGIEKSEWAQENYYAHYIDFDVIMRRDNGGNWGEPSIHVYNIGLYRDDATDPTGWRVRIMSRDYREDPYTNLTEDGVSYLEGYRPLTYDELEALGDLGGRVLFAAELLYQENTTWVYIYKEDINEIVRAEVAYSNIGQYISQPSAG